MALHNLNVHKAEMFLWDNNMKHKVAVASQRQMVVALHNSFAADNKATTNLAS